ncbi:hypothetical protein [Kitasatospora sp. NPDC094011]|uniref:hypothetical protein n=1 Tax=Kitasatospora sp. NPDC094011 TaxID=3364090 RepID=UPI0038188942
MPITRVVDVVAVLVVAVALLFAVLVGAAAGVVSRIGGANTATAILRAGAAFGGALTLILAMLTLIANWRG